MISPLWHCRLPIANFPKQPFYKLSATGDIANFQLPIGDCKATGLHKIGNWKSAIGNVCRSLMVFV